MFAYLLLLMAATLDAPKPVKPTLDPIPAGCFDGTISPNDSRCPPTAAPPMAVDTSFAKPPPPNRTVPPKPRTRPGDWLSSVDYPSLSLRNEEEGTVGFRVTVGPHGRVENCEITMTSGFPMLDEATCVNISRRARFSPALDAASNPTVGTYSSRAQWKIPAGPSYARQIDFAVSGPQATYGTYIEINEVEYPIDALQLKLRGYADLDLAISETGKVTACTVTLGSGHAVLDEKACEIAKTWTFLPARSATGEAVKGSTSHLFSWVLPDAWKNPAYPTQLPPFGQ